MLVSKVLRWFITVAMGLLAGLTLVWAHCKEDKGCTNCRECWDTYDYCCHTDPGCFRPFTLPHQFYKCHRIVLCKSGSGSSSSGSVVVGWFTDWCAEAGECCSSAVHP